MAIQMTTKPFRAAFVVLVEPEKAPGSEKKKYSITMLFDKDDTAGIMEIRKTLYEATVAEWGPDKAKWPATLRAIDFKTYVSPTGKDGWPIRDGDTVTWNGFPGCWFVKASTNGEGPRAKPPVVLDKSRNQLMDRGEVVAGLICRAAVNVAAYDANGNKGLTLYLNGVQILKDDGVRLGSSFNADEAFDAWEDEGDVAGFDDSGF